MGKPLLVRLPDSLDARLRAEAKRSRRSLQVIVEAALEEHLDLCENEPDYLGTVLIPT